MPSRPGLIVAALLAASQALASTPNPHLDRAREHFDGLEFRQAFDALEQALGTPDNDRESLLEILQLRGLTAAALDRPSLASDSFRRLLSLDPDRRLPREFAPRIQTLFDKAREWGADRGKLQFEVASPVHSETVRVKVVSDPLGMARRMRFHFGAEGRPELLIGGELESGDAEVEVPRAARRGWWVELLGDRDAVLGQLGSAEAPLPLPAREGLPAFSGLETPPRVHAVSWGLWGTAGAALAVGSFYGLRSSHARSQVVEADRDARGRIAGITQAEALVLEQRSRREAIVANALFATAVGFALAGGGVWWWSERLAVAPAPGGVGVGGTFP